MQTDCTLSPQEASVLGSLAAEFAVQHEDRDWYPSPREAVEPSLPVRSAASICPPCPGWEPMSCSSHFVCGIPYLASHGHSSALGPWRREGERRGKDTTSLGKGHGRVCSRDRPSKADAHKKTWHLLRPARFAGSSTELQESLGKPSEEVLGCSRMGRQHPGLRETWV